MKDCYEISKKVKIIGRIDYDDDGNKVIYVDMGKDLPTKIIDFNTIIDSIIGQQIKIETSLDVE